MAGTHHTVGQSRSVFLNVLLSSVPLQSCVELLQIVLRQLVQRYLADLGDDVIVDSIFVVLLCQRSDGRLGVVLVPELDSYIYLQSLQEYSGTVRSLMTDS